MSNRCICISCLAWIVIVSLSLAGCSQSDQGGSDQSAARALTEAAAEPFDSVVIELRGVDSVTVFEILRRAHEVDFFTTAAGVFVKAIDSLENSNDFFWVYSVNGTMPQVASDKYLTSNGDSIRWHYRSIEP